jgi:FkbH-like protein
MRKYHGVDIGLYTMGAPFVPGAFPEGTKIGRFCSFFPTVRAFNANHPMNLKSTHAFFYNPALGIVKEDLLDRPPTVIGSDIWMGHNAIILPSVRIIGDGAVIGSGSVVNEYVPPYAVVTGYPARVVRYRFKKEVIAELLASRWWDKPLAELTINLEDFRRPLEGGPVRWAKESSAGNAGREDMARVTAAEIRGLLLEMYGEKFKQRGISPAAIGDRYDLLREGIIDSLGILEMIAVLEERLGCPIELGDLDRDQLTEIGPFSRHLEEHLRARGRRSWPSGQAALAEWNQSAGTLTLTGALDILKKPVPEGAPLGRVFLACGFTPLHLQTFLTARLREAFPERRIEVETGLYGDLAGNLERLNPADFDAVAVVIEWEDLDPRLGARSLGGWGRRILPDIVQSAKQRIARLTAALRAVSATTATCVCMPTLPLPPVFPTRTTEASDYELQLRQVAASFAAAASDQLGVRVVSPQNLDDRSAGGERFDLKSQVMTGFPYKLVHASVVAKLLTSLIQPEAPKKGLITDLDDTLWAGILGEVGVDGVSWHLDQNTHMHGLYQQVLDSLASSGVLIAASSKNDPELVGQAFERKDLLISRESVYPIEAVWTRKSESVQRILRTWNIGPEAVVFIDDSPMEVAEVKAAFPEMDCIVFPNGDHQAIWILLLRLRDLFGKKIASEEDAIRLKSIREGGAFRESLDVPGGSLDDFLKSVDASIKFAFGKQVGDGRALELINKTNQFNLNGKRMNEAAWRVYLSDPTTFLMTVNYEDKYGQLGKIAVLLGREAGKVLRVDYWVMSCRAFSRRIEHQSLKQLFRKFEAEEICFDYQATHRNGPLHEFFAGLLGAVPTTDLRLSKAAFLEKSPSLFHRVEELGNG